MRRNVATIVFSLGLLLLLGAGIAFAETFEKDQRGIGRFLECSSDLYTTEEAVSVVKEKRSVLSAIENRMDKAEYNIGDAREDMRDAEFQMGIYETSGNINGYNAYVPIYNRAAAREESAVNEYNRALQSYNQVVEELNWYRDMGLDAENSYNSSCDVSWKTDLVTYMCDGAADFNDDDVRVFGDSVSLWTLLRPFCGAFE